MNDPAPTPRWPDVLTCVAAADAGDLDAALAAAGYEVLRFDGAEVADGAAVPPAVAEQFGLGDAFGSDNWDVFDDSLFEVLRATGPGPVALVWAHADVLVAGDLQAFLLVTWLLKARAIDDLREGNREVTVFLLGDGPGFARLDEILS